ncbi:MAG: glycosyltransferase family 4 protein [Phycisphaerae bacterium]
MTFVDTTKPSICFVVPGAYNVLSGCDGMRRVGGAEVQMVSMARALVDLGFSVSFITWDHGQPDGKRVEEIAIYKCFDPGDGFPLVRFFHPRWTRLNRAMARANAEVYLQGCADSLTGQVAMWCRKHRRRFAFLVMSDTDCRPELPYLTSRRERWLFRYGIRNADVAVIQTERQRALLGQWQSVRSIQVPPSALRRDDDMRLARFPEGEVRVLWLGRFSYEKRIEWLLELARVCPNVQFDLVGGANVNDAYAQRIVQEAQQIANVHLHGRIPHSEVDKFYGRAHALALTSQFEGFPSVFLEAWSWGLPTVSTVDVDGVIVEAGLGAVADDVSGLAAALGELFSDPAKWEGCSRRAREHYLKHHTRAATGTAMERMLRELVRKATPDTEMTASGEASRTMVSR